MKKFAGDVNGQGGMVANYAVPVEAMGRCIFADVPLVTRMKWIIVAANAPKKENRDERTRKNHGAL